MQQYIDLVLHPIFQSIAALIGKAVEMVWYYPVVFLCLFCGIFFTIRFFFVQFRYFPHAIKLIRGIYDNPKEPGQITHFQALMAALSGTIGLGNIAGVAIAISIGGPGTIFWMWIMGILGMATKFVECTLGTKYRDENKDTKEVFGGPMYYISKKLPKFCKPLAVLFAFSTIFGAFGAGGMFQANQAAAALSNYFSITPAITGIVLAISVAMVIIGGIKRIGNVASKIVPSMCIIYILGAIVICLMNITEIPRIIGLIITDAFTGNAVAGGSIGTVIIWGIRRAVFSNEAGLGSASIAHAAVKTKYPIREGIVASLGPLIDTLVVCTATAIVIILSGQYGQGTYTPQSNIVNFEQPQRTNSKNWKIKTKDDNYGRRLVYNTNKNEILTFKTKPVTVVDTSKTWYGTPVANVLGDGIQFSTKRGKGNYALYLRDKNDGLINAFRLNGDNKLTFESNLKTKNSLKIVNYVLSNTNADNTWQHHTLSFKQQTKDHILESEKLHQMSIEFVVDKNSGPLEIDNIFVGSPKTGIELTIAAFDHFIKGFGSIFITIAVVLFAFSTMITWSYYGEVALTYLFGKRAILPFKWVFIAMILLGSSIKLSTVLNFSDLMIGLMVIPNTIAIFFLVEDVYTDYEKYFKVLKGKGFKKFK